MLRSVYLTKSYMQT